MADITVMMTIKKTITPMSGAAYDAIEAWIKLNIKDKLPIDATESHTYSIVP